MYIFQNCRQRLAFITRHLPSEKTGVSLHWTVIDTNSSLSVVFLRGKSMRKNGKPCFRKRKKKWGPDRFPNSQSQHTHVVYPWLKQKLNRIMEDACYDRERASSTLKSMKKKENWNRTFPFSRPTTVNWFSFSARATHVCMCQVALAEKENQLTVRSRQKKRCRFVDQLKNRMIDSSTGSCRSHIDEYVMDGAQ